MATFITRQNDRWDLIASDLWQLPDLGWAIADENPNVAEYLILPAGISLAIPELRSLRRPLTAANPAREDDGEFQQLPPQAPSPIVPPSGGGGSVVFPITVAQGGTGGVTAQEALQNLGAVALASVGAVGGIAGLDGTGKVSVANLPPFQSPITLPLAISQGGTGATTAGAALSALGAMPASDRGATGGVAPLVGGVVPAGNLPAYPTLASLGAASLAANQTFTGQNKFSGTFSITSSTTNLVDLNVGAIANAFYWFSPTNTVNVGQRLSDIVKISNGNLVLRHLTDNYSAVTFQWQFTASGNLICPGMVQSASFSSNPTAAINIPGGFYYNTAIGCMVYSGAGPSGSPSAGTVNWRRMDTNAIVT